jgi:hypothetical protein
VKCGSAAERGRVIAAFKKNGITRLPDGRAIADIVTVKAGR